MSLPPLPQLSWTALRLFCALAFAVPFAFALAFALPGGVLRSFMIRRPACPRAAPSPSPPAACFSPAICLPLLGLISIFTKSSRLMPSFSSVPFGAAGGFEVLVACAALAAFTGFAAPVLAGSFAARAAACSAPLTAAVTAVAVALAAAAAALAAGARAWVAVTRRSRLPPRPPPFMSASSPVFSAAAFASLPVICLGFPSSATFRLPAWSPLPPFFGPRPPARLPLMLITSSRAMSSTLATLAAAMLRVAVGRAL
mmetsp:Transcript_71377/g.225541  ORF Transcript_71377/g.225541 Transcript_71377/m.225541 type:complete len:256 (+) Transcript_71377:565-1332(+)